MPAMPELCPQLERHLQFAANVPFNFRDGINAGKLQHQRSAMRPNVFHPYLAPALIVPQDPEPHVRTDPLRNAGMQFQRNFTHPALSLDDPRKCDEHTARCRSTSAPVAYSRISNSKLLSHLALAALRSVRSARALRPCRPITLPRSVSATSNSSTVISSSWI